MSPRNFAPSVPSSPPAAPSATLPTPRVPASSLPPAPTELPAGCRVCVILPVPPSAAWSDPGRELLAAPLQPALGRAVQVGRVFVQVLEEPLAKPAPESVRLPVPAAPTSPVLCSRDRALGMPMGL